MTSSSPAAAGVAAIVVNYNAAGHLGACLETLGREGVRCVLVVDNASTDGSESVVAAAGARWLESGSNLGYGRAANLAAADPELSSSPYLLICNPDLEMKAGSVTTLLAALERDRSLAAVGPRITNPDGSLYPSARAFPDLVDAIGHGLLGFVAPENRFTRRYRLLDWDHAEQAQVDWISGACLLVRREAWDAVGGFDASYFMYMEDVDLCWRLREAGWGIAYEPAAEVLHIQGVSADRHPYRMLAAHHRSMWLFARRTAHGPRRAALPLVAVGLVARLVVAAARRKVAGGDSSRPAVPI